MAAAADNMTGAASADGSVWGTMLPSAGGAPSQGLEPFGRSFRLSAPGTSASSLQAACSAGTPGVAIDLSAGGAESGHDVGSAVADPGNPLAVLMQVARLQRQLDRQQKAMVHLQEQLRTATDR